MRYQVLALLVLAGCQTANTTPNEFLRLEQASPAYKKIDLPFRTNISGSFTVPIYYRLFPERGRLGICGYFVNRMTGYDALVIQEWFKAAEFFVAGKSIGSGAYMDSIRPGFNEYDATARCVVTPLAWEPAFAVNPAITARGRHVTVQGG